MVEKKTPSTLLSAVRYFTKEKAAEYIQSIKWPEQPCCPACGSVKIGTIASRNRFQCREKGCRKQFSLTTGTIFEATHLSLDQWVVGVWMIVNCKNGVSSCEIARAIGCKQQSAWHLLHRVRHTLAPQNEGRFSGAVESDETFVGGLFKFKSMHRRRRAEANGRPMEKAVVHAMKERGTGRIRAEVIPAARLDYVRDAVLENVAEGSTLHTDSSHLYKWAKSVYKHETVDHSREYVKGDCHTNGLENYFNCLRRGLKGTYIKTHQEHLPAYVNEQTFRFNNRTLTDWERFEAAMKLVVGTRLTYRQLTDGAKR